MTIENTEIESMKQIIKAATIQLMDYGGTDPEDTCEVVAEDHPELYAAIGEERVLALCWEIHESSDPEDSALLQKLFEKFNKEYFGGQLDGYKVLAAYSAGPTYNEPTSGRVDFLKREIDIELTECRAAFPQMLLHHMAHVATGTLQDTDETRIAEMRRLGDLGAPVGEKFSLLPNAPTNLRSDRPVPKEAQLKW